MPIEPILQFAQSHHLLVFEDCAQAYVGDHYRGHPQSDVSLFSFGPIKTATALAGGMLRFRDVKLCKAVRSHQQQWSVQPRLRFLKRIVKYSLLTLLSYRLMYSLFVAICWLLHENHDRIINKSVQGFPGDRFFTQIRQRPSVPLLLLLERRLQHFNRDRIVERMTLVKQVTQRVPSLQQPGCQASNHTHWVFPIMCDRPQHMMQYLWSKGFDATQAGSSLYVVEPPADRPELAPIEAQQAFEHLLYLPLYTGISSQDVDRLAHTLNEHASESTAKSTAKSTSKAQKF